MSMYYVVNLRETQRTSKSNVNDIGQAFYEKSSKRVWEIAIVTRVSPGRDSDSETNSDNYEDEYNPKASRK